MPTWNKDYYKTLEDKFTSITDGLDERLEDIIQGRVVPAVDDLPIGSAKSVRAAVIFFDICNFSGRTGIPELPEMKKALFMLDCVIPMIMSVVHDYGGYVEKNTGDGVMAIVGIDMEDGETVSAVLGIALTSFYILKNLINPFLLNSGIEEVSLTVGIDLGSLLLARIGLPSGTAKIDRSFLTVVGSSANLSCRLQEKAGNNEIWVGDLIYSNSSASDRQYFVDKTPLGWEWTYWGTSNPYKIWHYNAVWKDPS